MHLDLVLSSIILYIMHTLNFNVSFHGRANGNDQNGVQGQMLRQTDTTILRQGAFLPFWAKTKVFYGQGKKGVGSFIHVSIAVGVFFFFAFYAFTHYYPTETLGRKERRTR